jgi:two-component system chemotaxis sensor kinase CheA
MNELTTALESVASQRANTLRMVQTAGIVLALLNFAFILFKFLRRLRTSDAEIEAANEENREILTSVREGLFLLTPDSRLGSQVSARRTACLAPRWHRATISLHCWHRWCRPRRWPTHATMWSCCLPRTSRRRWCRASTRCPTWRSVKNRLGQEQRRYLSFHFNRVQEGTPCATCW